MIGYIYLGGVVLTLVMLHVIAARHGYEPQSTPDGMGDVFGMLLFLASLAWPLTWAGGVVWLIQQAADRLTRPKSVG